MRYEESNKILAEATVQFMLSYVPIVRLKPIVRRCIIAMLEEETRAAMGFEEIPQHYPKVIRGIFGIRGFVMRNLILPRLTAHTPPVTLKQNVHGKYNRTVYSFEPYYISRNFWSVLEGYLVTGLVPSEKYHCDGYDIAGDLGPEKWKDKGGEEMERDMKEMEKIDVEAHIFDGKDMVEVGCPFKFRNEGIDTLQ